MRHIFFSALLLILSTGSTALAAAHHQEIDCSLPNSVPAAPVTFALPDPNHDGGCRGNIDAMAIDVDHDGRMRALHDHGGAYTQEQSTQAIEEIIASLDQQADEHARNHTPMHILIYAHGGMVRPVDAVARAEVLAPYMIHDGFTPIFLIWNSDLLSSLGNRYCCVLDGRSSTEGAPFFIPTRILGDVGTGIVRAPEAYGKQGIRFVRSVVNQHSPDYFLCDDDGWRTDLISPPIHDGCLRADQPPPGRDFGATVIYPPYHSYRELNSRGVPIGPHEILYELLTPARAATTVFEGAGTSAWENMVRRTRLAFQPPTDFVLHHASSNAASCASVAQVGIDHSTSDVGMFGEFFTRLQCEIDNRLSFKELTQSRSLTVDLYGHSMGSIMGDEILRQFPRLPYRRIVYMAAATSIRDFASSASAVLQRSDVSFFNLMLHPLSESHEIHLGGLFPEGSLLEWIDEYFEGPGSPDARTLGKWNNVREELQLFPDDVRHRMIFRVFAMQQKMDDARFSAECDWAAGVNHHRHPSRCYPLEHGEFDHYSFWRERYLCGPPLSANGQQADPADMGCPGKYWPNHTPN